MKGARSIGYVCRRYKRVRGPEHRNASRSGDTKVANGESVRSLSAGGAVQKMRKGARYKRRGTRCVAVQNAAAMCSISQCGGARGRHSKRTTPPLSLIHISEPTRRS
eukprot:1027214-Prymnesium_polylepis.1